MLAFSGLIGVTATLLAAIVYVTSLYPSLRRIRQTHKRAFEEIRCTDDMCNTSAFTTDQKAEEPDYVIDTKTRFFIAVPAPTEENPITFAQLDYSDSAFIAKFNQPAWFETPDGEMWRLYSRQSNADNQELEILVGFAKSAPWKMTDTARTDVRLVDDTLRKEADKLAASVHVPRSPRGGGTSDGYQIVDFNTHKVLDWGPWLPTFLPQNIRLPPSGVRLYLDKGDLYVVQTDTAARLLALSLTWVGSLLWLGVTGAATFVTSSAIALGLSRRFLRGYFALMAVRVPTLGEARTRGEGQAVEFKRGLSDDPTRVRSAEDELLKSIVAFANTNDGVIFIGIDDNGQITGLSLDFKQRDRLEQKIRQLVRTRIKPIPLIQITFENVGDRSVATITVPRGEATAYMMSGVIYVRDGSSDVQAQPDDLRRLIAQYAY